MSRPDTTAEEVAPGIPTPALLRAARGAYGAGIRRELRAAGLGGLPPGGSHIIGGMGNHGVALPDLARQLGGGSAGMRVVDALVANDYLAKDDSGEFGLTDKGRRAADAVLAGVTSVEDALRQRLDTDQYQGLRQGLVSLCDIREEWETESAATGDA